MAGHLVLTVIAPDRPGIVEALSQIVSDHGANWLGSRMARLAGEFAGIVEVSAPEARVAALREALTTLESEGLRIQVGKSRGGEAGPENWRTLHRELVGNDGPGFVREIGRAHV